jgi:hypothetical protein
MDALLYRKKNRDKPLRDWLKRIEYDHRNPECLQDENLRLSGFAGAKAKRLCPVKITSKPG